MRDAGVTVALNIVQEPVEAFLPLLGARIIRRTWTT